MSRQKWKRSWRRGSEDEEEEAGTTESATGCLAPARGVAVEPANVRVRGEQLQLQFYPTNAQCTEPDVLWHFSRTYEQFS